jgi:glycosyltransferase involved in cell wall biosynthesis
MPRMNENGPSQPLVDIAMPLYNEEAVLKASVERLIGFLASSGFPYTYVVTLVNNASTDGSRRIADDLARRFPEVKAMHLPRKGKGFAIRSAWDASGAAILSFMDADLSTDLKDFRALIDRIQTGGYDLAIGDRLGPGSKVVSRRSVRKILSRCYNLLMRALFRTGIADHQCGFKAMRASAYRTVAPRLRDDGFFIDTELIVLAKKAGYKIATVDVWWTDRFDSKLNATKTSFQLIRWLLDSAIGLRSRI